MERRIQELSTAVNSRPALNRVAGGWVEITDGGWLQVRPPSGSPPIFSVGGWSGEEFGLAIRRQTGATAMVVHKGDGSSTSLQPLKIFDPYGHEIIADDVNTGGLARPWLAMLPPQDTGVVRWPQTTSTGWTTIAVSYNPLWQPLLRLHMPTAAGSGATGSVRVLVDGVQWGPTVSAGAVFDHTATVAAVFGSRFGGQCTSSHGLSSAVAMPSTPGAPRSTSTRLSTTSRFSPESINSHQEGSRSR